MSAPFDSTAQGEDRAAVGVQGLGRSVPLCVPFRVGLEKAVRASVPLHAGDWVDWGHICVSPGGKELKGWCLDAPAHKGRAGYEDAVCGKDACWAVTRDAFSPSEMRRTARPVVASGTETENLPCISLTSPKIIRVPLTVTSS